MSEQHVIDKYFRDDKLPTTLCPGCGNGIMFNAMARGLEKAGCDIDKICVVTGVGCSARANIHTDLCGMHTLHGRPLGFATGVKMAKPDLDVLVVSGDGDCLSIGGNHFLHACRRNIDMTLLVSNNSNYGMTGGQYSPTTPGGFKTKTSIYGHVDPAFDLCRLAEAAGATYVARCTTYRAVDLVNRIAEGIRHHGFSVIEVMTDCPTLFGRINGFKSAADMMLFREQNTVTIAQAEKMSDEELKGKCVIGKFVDRNDRPEYLDIYGEICRKAKENG